MSWMKQRQGAGAPPSGPERQPYAAPQTQPFGNQPNMYPNYQAAAGNPQQQYWQMSQAPQQQQFNQQYGQTYQQEYPANANQIYQPQNQYNQNYNQYNNPQQGYNPQQNVYQHQPIQQQNFPQKTNTDAWEDNWDWGWDEASKLQGQKSQNMVQHQAMPQQQQQQQLPPQQLQQPPQLQQPVFSNANVIEESFGGSDSWSWSLEEKKEAKEAQELQNEEPVTVNVTNPQVDNSIDHGSHGVNSVPHINQHGEEVKSLNDREAVKERLPNLALGKRFHLDNLTPQWSIESQMSQESSDGPLTQSEGTYRSENQSRNSSKSSPGLNTDNSNFNYSQPGLDEYHQNSEWSKSEDHTLADSLQSSSRRQSHDELTNSMQEMRLNNHDNSVQPSQEQINVQENAFAPVQPRSAASPANFPAPVTSTISHFQSTLPPQVSTPVSLPPPPPPTSSAIPRPPSSSGSIPRPPSSNSLPRPPSSSAPLPPTSNAILPPPPSSTAAMPPPVSASLPPPPSSSATLPPPNFPSQSSNNPFKHAGPFSHKSTAKSNASHMQFPPPMSNTNLSSPSVVNKVSQHRMPVGFEANLETTPDNSERPDQPQMSAFRPMPVAHQVPDNLEVAPQNDRNEYLQTAHLSGSDYGENTDFSRNVPPPGLRRMVVGQQESEYSQSLNISGDEPPPGLARMVPGQQTEAGNVYNQSSGNYMDRHIDGQPTDSSNSSRYRQADGQQTPNNYTQPSGAGNDRRPIGLDRMVPGEPSNDEYSQYSSTNYGGNEQRVVTGVDHDFGLTIDAGPSDVREQNVDGSDYSEQAPRNPTRNVIGAREANDVSPDFVGPPEETQREVIMEGENLQDLSIISSTELAFSREQMLDGADMTITDTGIDRKTDISDSMEHPATSSRRQSLNRVNTSGEDSERDRTFKSSPRKDTRDRHKSSRDRDRDREREKDGRYPRDDRKYDREDRRAGRDERRSEKDRKDRDRDRVRDKRDRDESPESRRYRRSTRGHRYETEDTDYYSDKERERRRYREGSYTSSRPPRPDDKERRGDERDRSRRYNTIERDRRYEDEWDGSRSRRGDRPRDRDRDRDRDRYGRYRDIDPSKKYGNIRRERNDDRRRVVTFSSDAKTNDCNREGEQFSSPSRPESREATVTDDDLNESRRRTRRQRTADPYYDAGYGGSGYTDPYLVQRQQYQYYEHLRLTDPAAYMALYKQLMAGQQPHYQPNVPQLYREGYTGVYSGEERGSVHSGRSSTTGLKGNDTYYVYRHDAAGSLRDAPSLRTDLSDRDLNTDASLNLQLEESTVRSERMTPYRFSTAHVKGSISCRDVVVVRPSYPADGLPATVHVLSLAAATAHDPHAAELAAYPGPLIKGVTHKKSVMEYCENESRSGGGAGASWSRDQLGHVLLWQLLALLLRQNGVVVGSDIAELLMKNTREYEYKPTPAKNNAHNESRRESSVSGEIRDDEARSSSPDQPSLSTSDITHQESPSSPGQSVVDEKAALDRLREYLIYGNRAEALEWAMSHQLWGHAFQLGAHAGRRTRASVWARFLGALPRADPLHTLYAALSGASPPAATCVSEERWGDWRPHAAILLANASARPDHDRRTLTQLGDSLASRGLLYSAQFCYVSAGVPWGRHPLAPLPPTSPTSPTTTAPRLSLLLADPRATTLAQFATNKAIFATEIYEYALSLNQDYVITELQVYKLLMATRLVDVGAYERALAYTEQAARALTAAPQHYSHALAARLAELADRLKYHDPALHEDPPLLDEGPESGEPSPRHHQQWLDDVKNVAHMLTVEHAAQVTQATPQHQPYGYTQNQQYTWGDQAQQYQQPVQTYAEPTEETPDYATQYYNQQAAQQVPQQIIQPIGQQEPEQPAYPSYGDDWHRTEENHAQSYADPYWQGDNSYGYGERAPPPPRAAPAPSPAPPAPPASSATAPTTAPALKPDVFELVEFHRSPALRRRIHPKHDAVNVAFAEETFRTPTTRTVSRGSSVDSAGSKASIKKTQLSDLDIQIAHSPSPGTPVRPDRPKTTYPTEKTPLGRVISNTVDSWARQTVHVKDGVYKPLIFGGTYPIEVPASPPEELVKPKPAEIKSTLDPETHRRELRKTIEQSLDKFEAMLAKREIHADARRKAFGKRTVETFDIDAPAHLPPPPAPRPDHAYYLSGPHTYNIDEPVSFI